MFIGISLALPLAAQAKFLPAGKAGHWVGTWTAMPQLTEPENMVRIIVKVLPDPEGTTASQSETFKDIQC